MRISVQVEAEVWMIISRRVSRRARLRISRLKGRVVYPLHQSWVDLQKDLQRVQLLFRARKSNLRCRNDSFRSIMVYMVGAEPKKTIMSFAKLGSSYRIGQRKLMYVVIWNSLSDKMPIT